MVKRKIFFFLAILLSLILLLSSCKSLTEKKKSPDESTSSINAYFNNPLAGLPTMRDGPAQANGLKKRLTGLIERATYKVDLAIHSLNDLDLLDALGQASKRGVKIRILAENEYYHKYGKTMLSLKSYSNIKVKADRPNHRMHNKFMIVDKKTVLTGSLNWTKSGFYFNANHIVLIQSQQVARVYQAEFEQMFEHERFGSHKKDNNKEKLVVDEIPIEIYFSPSDSCEDVLIDKIRNASTGIHIAMFYYTNDLIHKALINAANRGVKVKAVWDFRGWEDFETSEMDEMLLRGVGVVDANPGLVHHKYAIIDGQTIITGSANWSKSGLSNRGKWQNDENILIIKNTQLANKFIEDFNGLYKDAVKYDKNPDIPPRVTVNHYNYQDVLSRIEWRPHLENRVDFYEICRSGEPNGPCEKTFSNIPANHRYFVDDSAKIGKTYYYRMRGFVDGEYTPYSNQYSIHVLSLDCPKSDAQEECSCKDLADNDDDGYVDCQDYDCATSTACLGPEWKTQEDLKAVASYLTPNEVEANFSKYKGRLVTVRYKVWEVADMGNIIFLNSSPSYKQDFTAVIFKSDKDRFTKMQVDPAKQYRDQTLEVTGLLQEYNGPEIVLRSPTQVRIIQNKKLN